jgi:hypothetical protein
MVRNAFDTFTQHMHAERHLQPKHRLTMLTFTTCSTFSSITFIYKLLLRFGISVAEGMPIP